MLSLSPRSSSRHSEASFRRFLPTLSLVLEQWPNPTALLPGALSIETYTHRFRDALRGFVDNNWEAPFTPADVERVFKMFRKGGTFIISEAKGLDGLVRVYFGPPAEHGVLHVSSLEPAVLREPSDITLLNAAAHPEILRAFALLKNHDLLSGVVTFTDVPADLQAELSATYPNIEFQKAVNNPQQTQLY